MEDPMLELSKMLQQCFEDQKQFYYQNTTFVFSAKVPMLLGSDGAPRCKYTGVKGGGHPLRTTFNNQDEQFMPTVLVQSSDMNFQLKDFWKGYEKQLEYEKGKDEKDIESM